MSTIYNHFVFLSIFIYVYIVMLNEIEKNQKIKHCQYFQLTDGSTNFISDKRFGKINLHSEHPKFYESNRGYMQ